MTTPVEAVLALVEAAADPVLVGDGTVPGGVTDGRYVVFYPDEGLIHSEDVANSNDLATFRFQLTYASADTPPDVSPRYVGTRSGVGVTLRRCRAGLIGVRPQADGWELGPIVHDVVRQIQRDGDVPGSIAFYAVDQFTFAGARA